VIADLHLDALLDVVERRELGDDDAFAQRHLPMLEAAGVRVQVLPAPEVRREAGSRESCSGRAPRAQSARA